MTIGELIENLKDAEECIERLNIELIYYKKYTKELEKELEKIETDNKV